MKAATFHERKRERIRENDRRIREKNSRIAARILRAEPVENLPEKVFHAVSDITLTVIRNPFEVRDRVIVAVPYSPIMTIAGYIALSPGYDPENEVCAAVNGAVIPAEKWPETTLRPGSYITIIPVVGKSNIMGLIIGLGLSYVAFGAGGLASGQGWGAAMSTWNVAGYIANAAVMALGGMLVSHVFPPPSIDNAASSQTYSWGPSGSTTGQGGPVPIIYGTVNTGGQVLAQHVTSNGTSQYMNLLICAGDGPIDAIDNITINDNPIAFYTGDGTCTCETRLGTNTQAAISFFADQYTDVTLAFTNLAAAWVPQAAAGNATQALEITFSFPSGLYHIKDDGTLENASVTVEAQYERAGYGGWVEWGTWTITAGSQTAFWQSYRIDNLTPGTYTVQVRVTATSGSGTRYMTRCDWTQVTSIIYDDLTRPGKALIGIKALATDRLSGGAPQVRFNVHRNNVYVWNPNTGGSGAYELQSATNPAWAAFDLIHRAKYLQDPRDNSWQYINLGAAANRPNYTEFAAWATFCTATNLAVNIIIDQATDLDGALKDIEGAGRGRVTKKGSKFGAIFDGAANPVQLFTISNIIAGTFTESFLGVRDRANSLELTFNNSAKNWQRDVCTVYSDDYDTDATFKNPTQIALNGITTIDQAWREAKYRLRLNKYLLRTCTFEAEVDAIGCQVGDVILVQHDVPMWGVGGRIMGVNASAFPTFARTSIADTNAGVQVATGVPRIEAAGLTIEEGTANIETVACWDASAGVGGFLPNVGSYLASSGTVALSKETGFLLQGTTPVKVVCDGSLQYQGLTPYSSGRTVVSANTLYTISCWAIGNGTVFIWGNGTAANYGIPTASPVTLSPTIPKKVTFSFTTSAGETGITPSLQTTSAQAVTFWAGGFDIEQKAYPTTSQPPTATRAAETATLPTSLLSLTEGTIAFDFTPSTGFFYFNAGGDGWNRVIGNSTAVNSNCLAFCRDGNQGAGLARLVFHMSNNAGTPVVSWNALATPQLSANVSSRIVGTWSVSAGTLSLYQNGAPIGTLSGLTAAQFPTVLGVLALGYHPQLGGRQGDFNIANLHISGISRPANWAAANAAVGIPIDIDANTLYQHPLNLSSSVSNLTLDKSVPMTAGQAYEVMIRESATDTIVKGVIAAPTSNLTTDTVSVNPSLAPAPAPGDVFAFGQTNISCKPFRVINISRSSDSTRSITCLEYIAAVYTEAVDVPTVNYSAPTNLVSNLVVGYHQDSFGALWLDVAWTPPRNIYNGAIILVNGNKDGTVDGTSNSYTTRVPFSNMTYTIAVLAIDLFGVAGQQVTGSVPIPVISGSGASSTPPASLDYFSVAFSGANVALSWRLSTGAPTCDGYEIRRGPTWASGQIVTRIPGKDSAGTTVTAIVGSSTYWVCPYNIAGYASTPISDTLTISAVPSAYQIATTSHYEAGATITGSGQAVGDRLVQATVGNYGSTKVLTYGAMKTETQYQVSGGAAGNVTLTGGIIDLGKVCNFTISPIETWDRAPDNPTIYSYTVSSDGIVYSPSKIVAPGQITGRYLTVSATITGKLDPGILSGLQIQLLASLQTQQFIGQAIAIGGTTFTYSPAYLNKPATMIAANNGAALTPKKISESNTAITFSLINAAGTDVGGNADLTTIGF